MLEEEELDSRVFLADDDDDAAGKGERFSAFLERGRNALASALSFIERNRRSGRLS